MKSYDKITKTRLSMQVEAKVTAVLSNTMAADITPETISMREMNKASDLVIAQLSDAEKRAMMHRGVEIFVRRVIGERIATKLWDQGIGFAATTAEVIAAGRSLKVHEPDILPCFEEFRECLPDVFYDDLGDYETLGRFAMLWIGMPKNATLGEVATVKAAKGNKLALSFLAWKEIK